MKTLVVYYSRKGSNRYLAERVATALGAPLEELTPRNRLFGWLLVASASKLGVGVRRLKTDPGEYDRIVLVGPIWMGTVVAPLYRFIKKYDGSIKRLVFVTCCGSEDAHKTDKFGYETVFAKMRELLGDRFGGGFALPITLAVEKTENMNEAVMTTRLGDDNFKGAVAERFEAIVASMGR